MEPKATKPRAAKAVHSSDWLADGFSMPPRLKPIEHYRKRHAELCRKNKYARLWKLRIEKHTNRHPMTGGGRWGWYSIFPFDSEVVGHWNDGGVDELRGVDFVKWAESANKGMSNPNA